MNVSRRYTNDIDDAKDILQNAYIKIFRSLKTFDENKGCLDAWLSRIVINEALQLFRKRKKDAEREKAIGSNFEELSVPEILSRLQAEDLLRLTNLLPEGYKIIFNLKVVEGYSHKEIAKELNISESTSRSQLTRSKRMLKQLLIEQKKAELC